MEPKSSQLRNHYLQKNQEVHLERALALTFRKTTNLHRQSKFEFPTQPVSIVLEIAIVHSIIPMKQDGDDTNCEISDNKANTLDSPPCLPISNNTIWTTNKRSYIYARIAAIICSE